MEMARIVLRPTGTWLSDARGRFLVSGFLGMIVAAGTALLLHPDANSSLEVWEIRGNLFTGIIIVELFSAMMGAANRLGLQWRSHVMGLGQGLFVWSTIAVLVDALHNVLGRYRWFTTGLWCFGSQKGKGTRSRRKWSNTCLISITVLSSIFREAKSRCRGCGNDLWCLPLLSSGLSSGFSSAGISIGTSLLGSCISATGTIC
jgi:hypothetical protein